MNSIEEIREYFSQGGRNKIVFCNNRLEGLAYIDVGYNLAEALSKGANIDSFDLLRQVIGGSKNDEIIGNYVAIENIDILFESFLDLDIHNVFYSLSINQCLVVKTDMQVVGGMMSYPQYTDLLCINIKNLPYLVI